MRLRDSQSADDDLPNKKLKISEDNPPDDDVKDSLRKEAQFVHDQMTKFQDGIKNNVFPDQIFLIESNWFNKWKN